MKIIFGKKILISIVISLLAGVAGFYYFGYIPSTLTVEMKTSRYGIGEVFWDSGKGYNENETVKFDLKNINDFETYKIALNASKIKSIRIDPMIVMGTFEIRNIRINNDKVEYLWTGDKLKKDLIPLHTIQLISTNPDVVSGTATSIDPSLILNNIPSDIVSKRSLSIRLKTGFFTALISFLIVFIFGKFNTRYAEKLSMVKPFAWLFLIILLAFIVRTYHITYPLNDQYAFRQTQTAGLIRDYYREGINMFYPTIITLGKPGYLVYEFPFYQAISAILYHLISPDVIWARFASIFFGLLSVLLVYRITKDYVDEKAALFASMFFAFAPLTIYYNRVPMIDTLTLLLSLSMLFFLMKGINEKNNLYFVIGIITGSIGLTMKSPYVAPLYLPITYMVYKQDNRIKALLNIRFLFAFIIPSVTLFLWQRHANSVNELYFNTNTYPFSSLYSSVVVKFHPFNTWFFGTLSQRLDIINYSVILGRIRYLILTKPGILFFIIGFIIVMKRKSGVFSLIWLFSILSSIMLFFKLNVVHDYYQLPLVPIMSILCGIGLASLIDLFRNKKTSVALTAIILFYYLYISSVTTLKLFKEETNLVEVGQFIDSSIEKSSMIATSLPSKDVWEPSLMYYADKHGFTVPHERIDENMIAYLRNNKIKYLIIVDSGNADGVSKKLDLSYERIAENKRTIIYDISIGEFPKLTQE